MNYNFARCARARQARKDKHCYYANFARERMRGCISAEWVDPLEHASGLLFSLSSALNR